MPSAEKKATTDALKTLEDILKEVPDDKKVGGENARRALSRIISSVRQERTTWKEQAETAEAALQPARDAQRKAEQELTGVKQQLQQVEAQLSSARSGRALAEQSAASAKEIAETAENNAQPQAHLEHLVKGPDQPKTSCLARRRRKEQLHRLLPEYLPDFADGAQTEPDAPMMIHQDAFAASYHADEYTLLGMAVKYAGEHGKGLHFTGKNGETC